MLALLLLALLTASVLVCFLPVILQGDFRWDEKSARLHLLLRLAGLHGQWRLLLNRGAQGHQLTLLDEDGHSRPAPEIAPDSLPGQALALMRRADKARRFLLKHTHPEKLDALLVIGTSGAARTALLTGTARAVTALLPPAWRGRLRLRVSPDFIHDRTALQLRCIIRVKLGTMVITSVMLLAAVAAEQAGKAREAFTQWITRSEN